MILARSTVSLRVIATTLLLLACLCFGGSASIPLYEMGLSIFALGCLLLVMWSTPQEKIPELLKWLILASFLLYTFQLIPLPDVVWNFLPQRHFAESLLPNSDLQGMRQSLSIVSDATLYSLIAAAPAFTILWLVAGLSEPQRYLIANVLILSVLCQSIIGIAQAAGAHTLNMYNYHHPNVAIGLFASRNHFADLLLMGTCILFAVRHIWHHRFGSVVSEVIFNLVMIVFLLAMIGCASRTGLIIFIVILFFGYALSTRISHRLTFAVTATSFLAMLWISLKMFPHTGIVKTTLARFEMRDDGRFDIWQNSNLVIQEYGIFGAGIGSFRNAYEQFEAVKSIKSFYVNAAHNEYIQLVIEMGLFGAIIAIIGTVSFFALFWNYRKNVFAVFGLIGIIAIIIHSLVDYPFRNVSINVVISLLISIVIYSPRNSLEIGGCSTNGIS